MLLVWLFMCVVGVSVYRVEARVTAEICQVKPQEKHCLIEWTVRDRWPHQERWVYDWRRRNCHTIRWADHCGAPKPDTNNFATEAECNNECSGWA
ncbi:jg22247 [Pararge aegeria aegeria]|uniref:Jg22247 protein n=2 Tax=Pararge aegeria TaxID=116150 RepID=A0A8S4QTX4_9NEOP|nr:jg22247 [Pararge aegeria aegeria]